MVESLSSDGLTLDRSSTEVVALEVGQNIMLTGNSVDVINAHRSSSSPEIVIWTTTASGLQPGSSSSWVNSNGTTTSSPTTPSTPLNTPLSATGVTPSPFTPSSSRGAQAKVPSFSTPPPVAPSAAKSSSGHPSWSPPWRAESKFSGSKMRVNQVHVYQSVVSSCKIEHLFLNHKVTLALGIFATSLPQYYANQFFSAYPPTSFHTRFCKQKHPGLLTFKILGVLEFLRLLSTLKGTNFFFLH